MPPSPSRRAQVAERRLRVLRMRMMGMSLSEIAKQTGQKSTGAVAQDLTRALRESKALLEEQAELFVSLEMERLDSLERQVQAVLGEARRQGEHETALKAADRLLRIAQRRSSLLGLDAPKRKQQEDEPAQSPLDDMRDELSQFRLRKRGIPGG